MSAPTPAPGDDRPREGYYPDPSIPGYVRYWNGASWVAGTSRPAPKAGEQLAPPPGVRAAAPLPVEETGPHFFDEDPVEEPSPAGAAAQHGSRPQPASSWGADRAHQSGFGDASPQRVAWPGPAADPRVPHGAGGGPGSGEPGAGGGSGAGPEGSGEPGSPRGADVDTDTRAVAAGDVEEPGGGTFVFRRPVAGAPAPGAGATASDEGTMTFRAVSPRAGAQSGGPGSAAGKAPAAPVPQQAAAPQPVAAPVAAAGPGGGQSSWAQQVHRLAGGEEQPVAPWKPPVEDIFQAAARRQAAARPAGLGKRLTARLIDTAVLAGVTAVAAVPLGTEAVDHVNAKIDAAKRSGETVTVWLLDGTTGTYLGIVLAVLLLFGVVYEALPTAKWGRTLGKRLLGLEVRDIEAHEPPSFGAALRRWLVYSVPGLLVVGVVGAAWCLFDRPWRQCWHDKAAGTFVAG